jgi:uncharacterized protein
VLARRASLIVNYQGVDISEEINKDLLSFSYTDKASGEADDISITLKDDKQIWLKDWFPSKGDLVTPKIETTNWRSEGDKQLLPCGRFFVDEPGYSGRPGILTLKAISSPSNSNFKDVERSRVWRNITLKAIGQDIAKRAGLSLEFYGNNNPRYSNKEQTEVSDSSFLSELCTEEGVAMKVTDSKIIIFDEKEFEKRESVATLKEWSDTVLNYDFNTSLSNTAYTGVNVKFYDSKIGRNIEFLYMNGEYNKEKSKIYQLNSQVRTGEEARRLAQKTLRKLNKRENTGTLSVVGNVNLLGGSCVDLEGFGFFSGKYYIESATHSLSGYETSIEVRKVLEGY